MIEPSQNTCDHQGRTQGKEGLGFKPSWAWYFTKTYYLCKGD